MMNSSANGNKTQVNLERARRVPFFSAPIFRLHNMRYSCIILVVEKLDTEIEKIKKAEAEARAILDKAKAEAVQIERVADDEIAKIRAKSGPSVEPVKEARHTGHEKTALKVDKKKHDEAVAYILKEFKAKYQK